MPIPKLSKNHLDLLSNLQNIYAEAHDEKKPAIDLVPSFFGHKLHSSTIGWRGRVLRVIYIFLSCFVGDTFLNNKLRKAVHETQKCFLKLEEFRKNYHDSVYQDYLNNRFINRESQFLPEEIENARRQIRIFYQATFPLSQLVRKQTNAKLNRFLESYFPKLHTRGITPFYCSSTFTLVKDYVRMMTLENFAENELPLSIFRKKGAANEDPVEPLEKADEKALIAFVKKMHKAKAQGRFRVEKFHSAMKSIIRNLKYHQIDQAYDLKLLEKELIREGCIFLDEFDEKHIEWRQKLKKGDRFLESGQPFHFKDNSEFSLGEVVGNHGKMEDHYKLYEIHDAITTEKYEDLLMIVGPNKICLEYRDIMRRGSFWGLETAKIRFIHPEGKYAIIENLPYAIDSIDWESGLLEPLNDQDKRYAEPLRRLIQFFVDKKNSPQNFKSEYLKFDALGELKAIKDCIPSGRLDYMALEEIAYQLAQGKNLPVYQYLVEPLRETKYSRKKLIPFFREAISSAFENHAIHMERVAKRRKIEDAAVIARAVELQKFATRIKEDCYATLNNNYQPIDRDQLREHMRKSLLELYDQDKTFGRFWSTIHPEDLLEQLEKDLAGA